MDELIDYAQLSKVTGIKVTTLYAMVCEKRIPHVRITSRMVRFRPSEIEKWLAGKTVAVATRVVALKYQR